MITLDTNILVRLLVEDDPVQTKKARRALRQCAVQGNRCFVSTPMLCELIWVLRSAYKVPREELVTVVQRLLDEELYEVENTSSVKLTLERFRQGKGDFADYLIAARGQEYGSTTMLTFDRGLHGEDGFELL